MEHSDKQSPQSGGNAKTPPDTEHHPDQTNEGESSEAPAEGGEETAPRQPGSPG